MLLLADVLDYQIDIEIAGGTSGDDSFDVTVNCTNVNYNTDYCISAHCDTPMFTSQIGEYSNQAESFILF